MLLPTWVLLWESAAVLRALGQDPALAALAQDYTRAAMFGMPGFCGFVVLRGFLAAMERPGAAMWVAFGAVALNLPLAWAADLPGRAGRVRRGAVHRHRQSRHAGWRWSC